MSVRSTAASGSTVYESERAVHEYLQFHYASDSEILPYADAPTSALGFTKRLAEECANAVGGKGGRALDIGCAVGGASFELRRHFDSVLGIDFSQAFVDAANQMQADGTMPYSVVEQAHVMVERVANLPADVNRDSVAFEQGDACNLREDIGEFDAVLCSNLLCRLPKPRDLLHRLPQIVKSGGSAIMVSPYSWLEEYTEKEEWMGGYYKADGTAADSIEEVTAIMSENFELVSRKDMPFMIREHARKYQWGISDATVWKRK
jgi:putative 4-mercaptohistidine N1-methyltranferase